EVGEGMARVLVLAGGLIDGGEACRSGLINAVAPAGQLLDQAQSWARSLAEGGPHALAFTKSLLHQFSRQALSIEEAAQASAAPRLTEECRHGFQPFFAKKPTPSSPHPTRL